MLQVDPGIVDAVLGWMEEYRVTPLWVEKILISKTLGYGGKPDLVGSWRPEGIGRVVVVDWKSQKTTEGKPIRFYKKEWVPLLAAYGRLTGLTGVIDHISVVPSQTEPGRIDHRVWTPGEVEWGWIKFKMTRDLYFHDNGYDPRLFEVEAA